MGADVMRWMYCRNNPTQNINFGPLTADEVRSRFVLKLWNTYAFFCNYARPDGFDPTAAQVPIKDRPDIDRWVLSDLQLLIKKARDSFAKFNVQAFCLEAEKCVDDKLSNWYVRRNRKRFWSKNTELNAAQKREKLAAYQTLYTVLMTLTKLCAPIMPFLTEQMYQNLRPAPSASEGRQDPSLALGAGPESVHLCDFPAANDALIDEHLSEDVDALLDLVTLGLAARQKGKINVRRPLAELKVQPGSEAEANALRRFADQLKEELNVKKVTLHDPKSGSLLRVEIRPNMKTLGPKFGPRLNEVLAVFPACPPEVVAARVQAGTVFDLTQLVDPRRLSQTLTNSIDLAPEDVLVELRAPEGWVAEVGEKTQVLLDVRVTPELAREGLAREVVRRVQDARKDAGLDMEDHIELSLATNPGPLAQALAAHRDYIAVQTQTDRWPSTITGAGWYQAEVTLDGAMLTISIRKV
jgi:isoleucyl-tRNA synthetase